MNSAIENIRQATVDISIESDLPIDEVKTELLQYLDTPEVFDEFFQHCYSQLPEYEKKVRVRILIAALLY